MQTPMLKQADASPVVTTAEAHIVKSAHDVLEVKATSLRRAATALLFFGMMCARPCPSSWGAWLAIVGACAVLCSSGPKLLCRSRVARFTAFFTAIFAAITIFSLVQSFRAGMPLHVSATVHEHCDHMPKETFVWAKAMLVEHPKLSRGLSFLSRHMPMNDTTTPTLHLLSPETNASLPAVLVGSVAPEQWSQPEACDKISHIVLCFAKMYMIGNLLAHLLLLLAAASVVKRVCRLRCAAFRAGLLQWKCCKARCKRAEPSVVQAVTTTPAPTAGKEMA